MINVKKTTNDIIKFIRNYYQENNLKGAVIGVSGGKDSAVALSLFTKALGSTNVEAFWLPIESNNEDYLDAKNICEYLNVSFHELDLTNIYKDFISNIIFDNIQDKDLINSNINIKPRLRMMSLYYYAALLSSIKNGTYIVAGTSNKCEIYVGYFTKGGDSVSDINVLSDLTVSEVIAIGEYLNLPSKIIHKTPSDGISGMSDEDKLGFTYADVEKVINNEEIDITIKNKIIKAHNNNLHKYNTKSFRKS